MAAIKLAAMAAATNPPLCEDCTVVIHLGRRGRGDIDNRAKLVLDSLIGVAYDDDRRVQRLVVEHCIVSSTYVGVYRGVVHDDD